MQWNSGRKRKPWSLSVVCVCHLDRARREKEWPLLLSVAPGYHLFSYLLPFVFTWFGWVVFVGSTILRTTAAPLNDRSLELCLITFFSFEQTFFLTVKILIPNIFFRLFSHKRVHFKLECFLKLKGKKKPYADSVERLLQRLRIFPISSAKKVIFSTIRFSK